MKKPKASNLRKERFFLLLIKLGYLRVTKSGRVFNLVTEREIAASAPEGKYKNPKGTTIWKIMVHRLVWIAFKGPVTDETLVVNHKDHDKHNCRLSNLELVTEKVNLKAARDLGRYPSLKGGLHHLSKLTDEIVVYLRRKHAALPKSDSIFFHKWAEYYEVHPVTLRSAVTGRSFKHLAK